MNFLRISNLLVGDSSIVHLADHDLEFSDAVIVNFAEIVHQLHNLQSPEGGDGGGVLGLDDGIVANLVVAEERAIDEVRTVSDAHAA
jgi:hypothetical protein